MWWSVATLTTVGYGDIYPITTGGKIFSTFIVFIGLGLVAVPTGLIASSLTQALNKKSSDKDFE
jgi:voltage-gated potassium channel